MTKHFCDLCEREVTGETRKEILYNIQGFSKTRKDEDFCFLNEDVCFECQQLVIVGIQDLISKLRKV